MDSGTSILRAAQVRSDFVAETTLEAVAQLVHDHGLPQQVTVDRDPRFVGSAAQRDFPSAFLRCWLCRGVQVEGCLPHHPQQHGFVERYHRTLKQECLPVDQPQTEDPVRTITSHFQRFYTEARPHQGLSCQNQPPRSAFPTLPTLPAVPAEIDPDRWRTALHGRSSTRRVNANGTVSVAETPYYIRQTLRGQDVRLEIDAAAGEFVVYHQQQAIKRLPVRGLVGQRLAFSPWMEQLVQEARRDERRRWQDRRRRQAGTSPADTRC
ncbi:MAG TPA: integrase core domain-containing protein [Herpetosiphonaceae bacterium]